MIDVKWIYKGKRGGTTKATIIAKGFQQSEYLYNINSPVSNMQTLNILPYSCENVIFIEHMDDEAAFLNGKVKGEVSIQQPQGYCDGSNKVYNLYKVCSSLYALKQIS